jgi:hypothetical protein
MKSPVTFRRIVVALSAVLSIVAIVWVFQALIPKVPIGGSF